jgi:hypothetical protein
LRDDSLLWVLILVEPVITREQIKLAGIASQTDKVTHHAYERFFPRFVSGLDGTGSIVEIGYGDGASIGFWKNLFPGSYLYVLDRDVELEGDGFRVVKCDQSSKQQLTELSAFLEGEDIALVVDDGSHVPEHQLEAFNCLFGVLRNGGVYIIEDIECSYWRNGAIYGYPTEYGVDSSRSLVNKMKTLVDWVNREFLSPSQLCYLREFLQFQGFNLESLGALADISFGHNCLCLSKCLEGDEKYYRRSYKHHKWVEHVLKI